MTQRRFEHKKLNWIAYPCGATAYLYAENGDLEDYIPAPLVENSNDWQKITEPEPMLTTEEGVPLYEGFDVFEVDLDCLNFTRKRVDDNYKRYLSGISNAIIKVFRYVENAKDYIEDNKPRFSKHDIQEVIDKLVKRKNMFQAFCPPFYSTPEEKGFDLSIQELEKLKESK